MSVEDEMPDAVEVLNDHCKGISEYELRRLKSIQEREEVFEKIFGPPQKKVAGKLKKTRKRENKLCGTAVRKSERLDARATKPLYSCPVCPECFFELSDEALIHYESH
eukprot:GFUD01110773.1.p1 GENE.GFUD01110773.1~~GFUD01110773.1.p1  ORF type:complete len:108 (+),score=17.36 GFUD01110773.1:51-374(+)